MPARYGHYCWLVGSHRDEEFDREKLNTMLGTVKNTIRDNPDRTKYTMSNFVVVVGASYLPPHERALVTADAIGVMEGFGGKARSNIPMAAEEIRKVTTKERLGFRRRSVRY